MALVTWNDSLSVKINSFDREHKKLIDMLNEVYENLKLKSNKDITSDLIKNMKQYIKIHFNTEEKYLKRYNYSGYEYHKKEHDVFVAKVEDLEKRFDRGKLIMTIELTDFLRDWLKNHIQGTDMQYVDFLKKKGVV